MSRTPKSAQLPAVEPAHNPNIITQERRYELITPLFGGGAEPQQADPITVVRASEVRGQLRFWWRATRGGQFDGSLERMKAAEDALFGSMGGGGNGGGPSLVQVEVFIEDDADRGYPLVPIHRDKARYPPLDEDQQPILASVIEGKNREKAWLIKGTSYYRRERQDKEEFLPLTVGDPDSLDGYLAFPLRKDDSKPAGYVLEGVRFTLRIRYPNTWVQHAAIQSLFPATAQSPKGLACEIAAALWAWETFGGIGARTRRGFGAINLISIDSEVVQGKPTAQAVEGWLKDKLREHVAPGQPPRLVPSVSTELDFVVRSGSEASGRAAWRWLGERLKAFRQRRSPGYPRNGKPTKYGRSKWPEPDAVRELSDMFYEDKNDSRHKHDKPTHGSLITAFPRAAFGLPISFEFHRDHTSPKYARKLDPTGKNTLEGDSEDQERLASPLILRPLACAESRFVSLAILLRGVELPPLKITTARGVHKGVKASLTIRQAHLVRSKGVSELPTTTSDVQPYDILLAFLESLRG